MGTDGDSAGGDDAMMVASAPLLLTVSLFSGIKCMWTQHWFSTQLVRTGFREACEACPRSAEEPA